MKLRIVFQPIGSQKLNVLCFLEVQAEDGSPVPDNHPCLEWLADGDHEALIIDTDKLQGMK